jgi:aspartyl-tRNA(Asn)/glutamyl-tRNA(Gln) amidotransferase subunit B
VLTADWIAEQRERVPTYPIARRERLAREYGLSGHAVDVLVEDPELADYYEAAARRHGDPRTTAEWVTGPVVEAVDAAGGELEAFALRVRPADLAELLDMIRDGRLGPSGARHVFGVMVRTGQRAPRIAGRDPTLAPSG